MGSNWGPKQASKRAKKAMHEPTWDLVGVSLDHSWANWRPTQASLPSEMGRGGGHGRRGIGGCQGFQNPKGGYPQNLML